MSADPYNPPKEQQKSGGGAMKWILIVLAILLIAVLACIGTCVWSGSALFGAVFAPGNDMTEFLNNNAEATAKLGKPIEQVGIADGGRFNSQIENSSATIEMTVKGPNGKAEVDGSMSHSDGKWVPQNITVTFEDGSTLQF